MGEYNIGSYSDLASDEQLILYEGSDNESIAASDLSAIKTYSQEEYGDEDLQGINIQVKFNQKLIVKIGYSTNGSSNSDPKFAFNNTNSPKAPEMPDHLIKLLSGVLWSHKVFLWF